MDLYSQHGYWYVFFRVFNPVKNKFDRKKRTTGVRDDGTRTSKETAELAGQRIERTYVFGQTGERGPTLKEVFASLVEARELAEQKSLQRTLDTAKHFFGFFGPDESAASIGTAELRKYAVARRATVSPNRATKVSAGTVRREFAEFTRALRESGLSLPKTPELPKYVPRERWLTPDECRRLLEAAPLGRRPNLLVYLQMGVRFSEAYRIEPGRDNNARVRGTKTEGADRPMPLTALASEALKHGLTPWQNANRELKRYCRRAGIEPCTFNDLRRTFATHLAIAGVPILHLMHLMGHKSTRMLEQVYARVEKGEHLHDAVALLPDLVQVGHVQPPKALRSSNSGRSVAQKPE